MRVGAGLAALRARAALGRDPQDRLEASVVLESWGVPQGKAMGVAGAGKQSAPATALDRWSAMKVEEEGDSYLDALGLVAGLLAATLWAAPLVARLGGGAASAWRVALPLTFLLQWMLRRRYFSDFEAHRRDRLSGLRSRPAAVIAVLIAGLLAAGVYEIAWLGAAAALVVIWTGGLLLVRRGWAPLFVALLLAGTLAFLARTPIRVDVLGEGMAVLTLVVAAVATSRPAHRWPRSWQAALPSGLVGLSLGAIIVAFWFPGSAGGLRLLAVAMLPPLLGGVAWFWVLRRFWAELWVDLAITEVGDSDRGQLSRTARRLDALALLAYLAVAVPLAVAGIEVLSLLGIAGPNAVLVFVDLGLIGLVGALFAWLEALRQSTLAIAIAAVSLVLGLLAWQLAASAGAVYPELVMALSANLLAALAIWTLHREPDRMAAQMLGGL